MPSVTSKKVDDSDNNKNIKKKKKKNKNKGRRYINEVSNSIEKDE
jgi:hypothetical protein